MSVALHLPSGQRILMDQSAVECMETLFEMAAKPVQLAEVNRLAMAIADSYGQTLVLTSPVWVNRFNASLGSLLRAVGITLRFDGVRPALVAQQWGKD